MAMTDAENTVAPSARPELAARLRARARTVLTSENGAAQRMAGMAFAIRVASASVTFLSQIALARWMGGFDFGIYVSVWTWLRAVDGAVSPHSASMMLSVVTSWWGCSRRYASTAR